jgi:hypothetical protein
VHTFAEVAVCCDTAARDASYFDSLLGCQAALHSVHCSLATLNGMLAQSVHIHTRTHSYVFPLCLCSCARVGALMSVRLCPYKCADATFASEGYVHAFVYTSGCAAFLFLACFSVSPSCPRVIFCPWRVYLATSISPLFCKLFVTHLLLSHVSVGSCLCLPSFFFLSFAIASTTKSFSGHAGGPTPCKK